LIASSRGSALVTDVIEENLDKARGRKINSKKLLDDHTHLHGQRILMWVAGC
jgi:hypothetical protein